MTVCFFGNYMQGYSRIEVLWRGLEKNGVTVLACHTRRRGFLKYWDLYRRHAQMKNQYDVMLVGMASYSIVWLARLLTRKKIIFDAFVSLYLTETEDRKTITSFGFQAQYLRFLEKLSFRLADVILFDTQAQIDYVTSEYQLPKDKFQRIFVGADGEIFHPSPRRSSGGPSPVIKISRRETGGEGNNEKFIVHWHGYIAPFHGLQTVIEAASRLKSYADIEFQIVTRFNSKHERLRKIAIDRGLSNIKFYPESSIQDLAGYINQADACLGIFGKNLKAQVVIPNKIFEAAACGKPIITAKSKALGELFSDQKNIIMIESGNSDELAQKILFLKNNPELRLELGKQALDLFKEQLTPEILGRELKNVLF